MTVKAVHFDGDTYLINTVTGSLQNAPGRTSQFYTSFWYRGLPHEQLHEGWLQIIETMGKYEEHFHSFSIAMQGWDTEQFQEPDMDLQFPNTALYLTLLEDENWTNYGLFQVPDGLPFDGEWHNVQISGDMNPPPGNTHTFWIKWALDGVLGGTSGNMPDFDDPYISDNFTFQVDGMYWQIANDYSNFPSGNEETCPVMDMAQMFCEFTTAMEDISYSTTRGKFIDSGHAVNIGLAGDGAFWQYPTIWLNGDHTDFPLGNAIYPSYPWTVAGFNAGGVLTDATSDPY